MKTRLHMVSLLGLLLAAAFVIPSVGAAAGQDTGNGALRGKHYNLNPISIKNIDQLPTNDETNKGNRIFCKLRSDKPRF